ncbi:DUF1287 domain-containing protein [Sphingorhabdus arenilitoris]|uniref:DUF1287 domain-containing protein n=1 Tax=Sphingorhabdus arenilitoris TaxID=1490041 RepID=A0ABV8RFN4_9SPHN
MEINRRTFSAMAVLLATIPGCSAQSQPANPAPRLQSGAAKLISAARAQIGVTLTYDPAYTGLSFPGGDVPREKGVCTDVVIRAYRDALGVDLQKLVHEDMKSNFGLYPKIWGLKRTDRNIDHRRVPNLRVFLERQGAKLPISQSPDDWKPGDMFTSMIGGRLPHIGIVSDRRANNGNPLVIHNIGRGTQEEDILFDHQLNGHFRWKLA